MDNKQVTAEWIAQQRAVCEESTPGEWVPEFTPDGVRRGEYYAYVKNHRYNFMCGSVADATFIACAHESYPAALDALEASMQREAEKDAAISRLTAERDAAIEDVKVAAFSDNPCVTCFYSDRSRVDFPCKRGYGWCGGHGWGYRGLFAENAHTGAESEMPDV